MSQHPILIFLISADSAHSAENVTFQTPYDSSPQFDLTRVNPATEQARHNRPVTPSRWKMSFQYHCC
jgi:hypothetical protein